MIENYDEILNKYIDGELSSSEIKSLETELENNPELLKKLKALKVTDNTLRNMEVTPAPGGFTSSVMSKIKYKSKIKETISPVFIGIVSFFSLLIISIIGFAFQQISSADSSSSNELVEKVNKNVTPFFAKISDLFSNENIMFVGGMIAFVLLLGLYFMINTHKSFKQSLEKF